jgi:hypothetical protein
MSKVLVMVESATGRHPGELWNWLRENVGHDTCHVLSNMVVMNTDREPEAVQKAIMDRSPWFTKYDRCFVAKLDGAWSSYNCVTSSECFD